MNVGRGVIVGLGVIVGIARVGGGGRPALRRVGRAPAWAEAQALMSARGGTGIGCRNRCRLLAWVATH